MDTILPTTLDLRPARQLTAHRARNRTYGCRSTRHVAVGRSDKPGPFSAGAIALVAYLGIRHAGKIIAMAGERMRFDGFTEISAVCTHPSYLGRGYASSLVRALVQQITARGETPFLHLYSDNTVAIALYTKLGFAVQRRLTVTVLRRAN